VVRTTGNPYAHIVLRADPNPTTMPLPSAPANGLGERELPVNIVVDCSHGNSNKDYRLQPASFRDVIRQVEAGNKSWSADVGKQPEGRQPAHPKDLTRLNTECR